MKINQPNKNDNKDSKRKLVAIRNNPGIYKVCRGMKDSGKFLSTRRTQVGKKTVREKAIFTNLKDAKDFRRGLIEKTEDQRISHKHTPSKSLDVLNGEAGTNFKDLLSEWRSFHFLTLEQGSKQFYERKLPFLEPLHSLNVEAIDVRAIDELVKYWVNECPKAKTRQSFEKELTLLTVILNFYRSRQNRSYVVPIDRHHVEASRLVRKVKGEVAALSEEDLARFLSALKEEKNPIYFHLAAVQFGLSLRIGEACALDKRYIDFERKEIRIGQTVIWNDRTWDASIKLYPKNDHVRYLSIPDFLVEILNNWIAKKSDSRYSLLFHKDGELMNRKTIGAAYNRVLKSLGIDYVSGTQMMRRTSATHANDVTGDFYAVSAQLDHSSPEITKRYVKRISSQKVKVANALNEVGNRVLVPIGPHDDLL